jgi:peptide/nickel transport system substrate-binding protein
MRASLSRRTQRWLRSSAAAVLAATLLGCPAREERGGTVVVALRSDFQAFNSITNSALHTMEIINNALFTPLVRFNADLEPEPYLAESWEEHGDTAVTLRLRRDVRWHDGQPVTAEDVKFTFDVAKEPAAASYLESTFLARVASAQVVDSFTITFRYSHPHVEPLQGFYWPPMPRHLLHDVAPAEMRNAPFNRQPVGSGPYRFGQWRANDQLLLVRNEDFPDALGGPPAPDRVVFRIIPEASTRLTEVITGSVHVMLQPVPEQAAQLRDRPGINLISIPGNTFFYIGWNHARPPFNDRNVRRALTLALNRSEIIGALLHGQGEQAVSTLPPWHRFAPDGVAPLPHDPEQAARLLDAAGWSTGPDGTRRNTNNQPLRFTLLTSDDATRRAVVEVVQSQLRRVGAQVDVRVMEFQTMLAAHRDRDFDAIVTNWVIVGFDAAAAPTALFHSSQADVPGSPNRSSVRIPRLDAAIERAAAQTTADGARAAYREYVQVVQDEQPFTFLFWQNIIAASRDAIAGVEMDPRGELQSIAQWSLQQR